MKAVIAAVVLVLATLCSPVAHAWNCSNPLAERVIVPAGTAGTYGDGDGQLASYNGQIYECEVVSPSTSGGNSNATSTSNSNSASNSQSTSNSSSQSSASGGKSSSTSTSQSAGGNATGGNATGGNSSSGVSSSGNSSNTNNNSASGGQGGQGGAGGSATSTATGGNQSQHQTQSNSLTSSGNSSSTASGNGVGNGNNSDNTQINYPRQVASAVAPEILPTVPCFKGYSAAGQGTVFGASFGGGKIDKGCEAREVARSFAGIGNKVAAAKILCNQQAAKDAGLTAEECQAFTVPEPRVSVPMVQSLPVSPVVINVQPSPAVVVPAPVVNVIASTPAPAVVVHAAPTKPRVPRSNNKCVPHECPKVKPTVWDNDSVEALPIKNLS